MSKITRTIEYGHNRPITKTRVCDGCGKQISPGQKIVVTEEQVEYDPEKHGKELSEDFEPGDMIWYWGKSK